MLRTIKGKLTFSVIGIVVASILLTTVGVITIADYMEKVEQSAERSGKNSAAMMEQMEELFRLSVRLNQTVASFRV